MILINCNSLCRIDMMRPFDGTFSEGNALSMVAWIGISTISIIWTTDLDPVTGADGAGLDAFFQRHLAMAVYPMAPMLVVSLRTTAFRFGSAGSPSTTC